MMKKFILRLHLFILSIIAFSLINFLLVKYFSSVDIDENDSILIIGHSHTECSFNDSLITGVANFSRSGESYFYTYYKLKIILEQNPQIKTVMVGFSNNQICADLDTSIWRTKNLLNSIPTFASCIDLDGFLLLAKKNPDGLLQSLIPTLKRNLKFITMGFNVTEFFGGYQYLDRHKLAEDISRNNSRRSEKFNKLSSQNTTYLFKILDYLEKENIKTLLIRSPLHPKYMGFNNEERLKEYLSNKLFRYEFLDFSKFPLSNSDYADLEHLNYEGARKFSHWFNELVNSGLLEHTNKQKLINEEISKILDASAYIPHVQNAVFR